MLFKLALRNLLGAGTRTWLNVFVTSLSFLLIIFSTGLLNGWLEYAKRAVVETEIGGGAYWHPAYDPEDPFALDDAHGLPPPSITALVDGGQGMPVLIIQGSMYPHGRMMPILIKGIPPMQQIVDLPTLHLNRIDPDPNLPIPVLIGSGMAQSSQLQLGDSFILRWLDAHDTYDARDAEIVSIMDVENFKIDQGQVWIPLARLQQLAAMPGEATYVVIKQGAEPAAETGTWQTMNADDLLRDVIQLIEAKQSSNSILYGMLLILAALGIFNSQVLSIFRRQREIGTLIAMGMTRDRVVALFTLEGGLHSLLALILGALYGGPMLYLAAAKGLPLPYDAADTGIIIGQRLYPIYSAGLLLGTTALVAGIVTVVSYLPARKIAQLEPTEALRGRIA